MPRPADAATTLEHGEFLDARPAQVERESDPGEPLRTIGLFGLAQTLWLALLLLALAGAADGVSGIFRGALWNETIPDQMRRRLAGVEMISWSSGPLLGNARAGVGASLFGLRNSVVGGGVLVIAGSVALALALPRFWNYDSRSSAAS